MTVQNAIKKLSKIAPIKHIERQYWIELHGHIISFYPNGEDTPQNDISAVYVKRIGDKDDLMSDYFCGTFFNNLTQAIRFVERYCR